MSQQLASDFETACDALISVLPEATKASFVSKVPVGVDIYPDYNTKFDGPAVGQLDAAMLVFANRSGTGALAIVPVALFEQGKILASATFSGTLAPSLRAAVGEVLVLRGSRWVCMGSQVLPTGRFPTVELADAVRSVLGS